jgi:hypothetical protein
MILARFTVADVGPPVDGQKYVYLKSEDDYVYLSFRRPASDNVMKGQEFILQSVDVAEEVPIPIMDFSNRRKFKFPPEPVGREDMQPERNDILSDQLRHELK